MKRQFLFILVAALYLPVVLATNILVFRIVAEIPYFTASPSSYNYAGAIDGSTCISNSLSTTFILTNRTTTTIAGGSASIIGNGSLNFSVTSGIPFTIAPNSTASIVVQYLPLVPPTFTYTDVVAQVLFTTSNAGSKTNSVTGRSVGRVSAFFTIAGGTGAAPATVTFTDSQYPSDLQGVWSTGDTTNYNLAAVSGVGTYTYTVPGTYSPSFIERLNGYPYACPTYATQTCVNCVVISGTNVGQIAVLPTSYNRPPVCTNSTDTFPFTVTNVSASIIATGDVRFLSGPFTISLSTNFILAVGASSNMTVTFAPTATLIYTGSFVARAVNGNVVTNQVIGTGLASASAAFSGSPTSGVAPLIVTFADASTGSITNRIWSFGDGGTTNNLSATNFIYTYAAVGTNTVQLITQGLCGISTNTKTAYIVATNVVTACDGCASNQPSAVVTNSGTSGTTGFNRSFPFNRSYNSSLFNIPYEWNWAVMPGSDPQFSLGFNTNTCTYSITYTDAQGAEWIGAGNFNITENTVECVDGIITGTITWTGTGANAGTVFNFIFNGGGGGGGGAMYVPPTGIPAPIFGINETVLSAYGATNYYKYYVHAQAPGATDAANVFGSPATPRLTIPVALGTGAVVEVRGTNSLPNFTTLTAGTATFPVFIRGVSTNSPAVITNQSFTKGSSYVIMENLKFINTQVAVVDPDLEIRQNSHHLSIRFCEFTGVLENGLVERNAVANHWNDSGWVSPQVVEQIVWYKNIWHDNAWPPTFENACQQLGVSKGNRDIWILENTFYHFGEDAIHIFGGTRGDDYAYRIYIGGNTVYETSPTNGAENAFDIKQSHDVVVSENNVYGFRITYASDGAAIVLNNDSPSDRIWVINNWIHDCTLGIRNQSSGTNYILGNLISDIVHETGTYIGFIGNGAAYLQTTGAKNAYLLNNTIYHADQGILIGSGSNQIVEANIISELNQTNGTWHLGKNNGIWTVRSNLFYQVGVSPAIKQSSVYTPATFDAAGFGTNNVSTNPVFTVAGSDFTLQASSPAIGHGVTTLETLNTLYLSKFGVGFLKDIAGTVRPQGGSWDIGAYEYVP